MGLAVLILVVLASAGGLLLTEHLHKQHRAERKDIEALKYVNTFVATLYMVLLTLIVVRGWQSVDQINADVRNEASTLTALVQTADRIPGVEGATVHNSAIDYAQDVLSSEWPPRTDSTGDAAAKALDAGQGAVTHPVALRTPLDTVEDQAISEYQTLTATRADRIAASVSETSPALLIALGGLSIIMVLTPLALGLRTDAVAFTGFGVSTLLVCLSFWLVLDLHTLYHGLIHANSGPLSRFLSAPGSN